MATTQTGDPGPHLMPEEYEWNERDGASTVMVYEGGLAEINGLLPTYQVPGYRVTRRKVDGFLYRLEIRAASAMDGSPADTSAATSEQWTLRGNDLELSLYELGLRDGLADVFLATIKRQITAEWDQADIFAFIDSYYPNTPPTDDENADAKAMVTLLQKGTTSFSISQWVLARSLSSPSAYAIPAAVNVGEIYTRAQLIAENANIATSILNQMPTTGYWLKRTPTISVALNGKQQLDQEWWHSDNFSTWIYNTV